MQHHRLPHAAAKIGLTCACVSSQPTRGPWCVLLVIPSAMQLWVMAPGGLTFLGLSYKVEPRLQVLTQPHVAVY